MRRPTPIRWTALRVILWRWRASARDRHRLKQRVRQLERGVEIQRLRDVLDAVSFAAREFVTLADYTVREDVEADLVTALDDADRALARSEA